MSGAEPGAHEPEVGSVVVGAVGKPLGIRGETYVHPDPDITHDFATGTSYRLADGRIVTVVATRMHGNRRVVRFAEATDRDSAESLRGVTLTVPRDAVELEPDSFWVDQLLGREVRDHTGELVGVLEGTRDGTAHDYFVVARTDGGELLIPAVAELVELTEDALVVRAIPGLLDPDETGTS